MHPNEYWRGTLTPEQKNAYDAIRSAILLKKSSTSDIYCSSPEDIKAAYDAIWIDHPEAYWMPYDPSVSGCTHPQSIFGGLFGKVGSGASMTTYRAIFPALYSASEQVKITQSIDDLCKMFLPMKNDPMAAAEAVADYLAKNIEYAQDNRNNQNAGSAIHYKRAQCSGISKAYKLILDRLGIWCIVITGQALSVPGNPGSAGPHAWNIVLLDGKYYHVDPTFLIPTHKMSDRILNNEFFLGSDIEFASGHIWDKAKSPPCPDASPYRTAAKKSGGFPNTGASANTPVGKTAAGFGDGESVHSLSSLYQLKQLLIREFIEKGSRFIWFDMNANLNDDQVARHVEATIENFLNQNASKFSARIKTTRSGKRFKVECLPL